jgi:CDP-glucose 4,6-dehydratase
VFLTGHTGFKGSWLSLWLNTLGASITGYALDPPTQPNLFESAEIAGTVCSIRADICDFATIKTAIADCCPEVVIHMAAQAVLRRGYEDPVGPVKESSTYAGFMSSSPIGGDAVRTL